jgi:hypothetical protein
VLAYMSNYNETRQPSPAYEAAFAALRQALPDMPEKEAWNEVMHAIAYAAWQQGSWFSISTASDRPTLKHS